jgi:hypothetical protein
MIGKGCITWVGFELVNEDAGIQSDPAMTPQEGAQML